MVIRISMTREEAERAILYWLNEAQSEEVSDDARIEFNSTDPAFVTVEYDEE